MRLRALALGLAAALTVTTVPEVATAAAPARRSTGGPRRAGGELVEGVASVAQGVTGVPVVSGLYFGVKGAGLGVTRRFQARPFEQFLYREFVRAWKRAGS